MLSPTATTPPPTSATTPPPDAALAAFANGLSDLISKHKKQTISIKAARSWQFRAKKSVKQSWAKVLKQKSSAAHLEQMEEEERAEGLDIGQEAAVERKRERRASLIAEEQAHKDSIRAAIVQEVEKYSTDRTTNFTDLFEKEVVYAVDELRTRDTQKKDSSSEDETEDNDNHGPQKTVHQRSSRRHSLSFKPGVTLDINEQEVDKRKMANKLIHGVFWHIHSALERRRARPLETFRTFDKDESGSITHVEFIEGCATMGYTVSNTESLLIFETLDADGSGKSCCFVFFKCCFCSFQH